MFITRHILSNSLYIRRDYSYKFLQYNTISKSYILNIRSFHTNANVFEEYYSWSDPNGPMKVLHDYNKVRIPFIIKSHLIHSSNNKDAYLKYLKRKKNDGDSNIFKGLKVFEVGCGGGILSEQLGILGANVLGIDSSKIAIEYANNRLKKLNSESQSLDIRYICTDLKNFSHNNNEESKFSMIICSEVLEHMSNEEKLLFFSMSSKLLSNDGILVITTPSKSLFSLLTNIIMAENIFHIVPKGTHSFSMFISYNELLDMAYKYGFSEIDSTGLLYIPFCRKFVPIDSKLQLYMASFSKNGIDLQ